MTRGAIAIVDWRSAIGDFRSDYPAGCPCWRRRLFALAVLIPLTNDRRFDQSKICNRRSAIANHSVAAVIRNLRLHPLSVLVLLQESLEARVLADWHEAVLS